MELLAIVISECLETIELFIVCNVQLEALLP